MSDERHEAPTAANPATGEATAYSPASERETEVLQDDQAGSKALEDPDIDRDAIKLLPGTGDYTDDGQVSVDPSDIHIPRQPDRDSIAPVENA